MTPNVMFTLKEHTGLHVQYGIDPHVRVLTRLNRLHITLTLFYRKDMLLMSKNEIKEAENYLQKLFPKEFTLFYH